MKTSIALTLVGLVAMSTSASAQVRVGGTQPRTSAEPAATVSYGAVARPQQKLSSVRKPAQVANVPARQPEAPPAKQQLAQHSPTTRPAFRTAQMPMGETVGAPMPMGREPGCATCNQGGGSGGYVDGSYSDGGCSTGCGAGGCGSGVFPYGPLNRMPLVRGWYVPFWHSTGDMPQHIPYFPNAHGYYYFHPYNVIHVNQQQEMVTRWGLDARNPMDNRFLERIYQEQEAAQLQDGGNQVIPQPVLPR